MSMSASVWIGELFGDGGANRRSFSVSTHRWAGSDGTPFLAVITDKGDLMLNLDQEAARDLVAKISAGLVAIQDESK